MPNENVPHSNQRITEETSSVLEQCLLFILKNISVCSWIRWLHNHGSQGDDVTWATNYNLYIIQPTIYYCFNKSLLFPLHLFYCAFLIYLIWNIISLQAYLILMHVALCTSQIVCFLQIEGLWLPCVRKSIGTISQKNKNKNSIWSLCLSL